ncbi:unnamed protein product [Alopecurus aequalis]
MDPHLRCMQQQPAGTDLAPNTKHPPPAFVCARARAFSCSGHPATLSVHSHRSRHVRALAAATPANRSLEGISNKNIIPDTKLRGDKFFELEMSVQDSELDQYGVVNNAVYCVYMEKAREALMTGLGISPASVACTGNAMALSELNLKYFTPLKRGAKFVVRVKVVEIKGVRILVEHFIETLPDRELVLEATATAVCLNKDYRPTRVFPELASKLQEFFSSQDG